MRNKIMGFVYGLIYGSLSPVPGISAGTLGVFMNIFDKFFEQASFANVKKNLPFVIIFITGWAAGLFGVSKIIEYLLANYGQIVLFSFKGLILGCVPMIFKKAKGSQIYPKNIFIFVVSLGTMLFIAFNAGDINTNRSLEEFGGISPAFLTWLFFASFCSSMAMLIPGVGGSLMMLVFGIYVVYIEAVSSLNPVLLIILTTSMVLGILAGIKIIQKLLLAFSCTLYSAILGFIIGSAFFIYPGFSGSFAEGVLSVFLTIGFAILSYRLTKKG